MIPPNRIEAESVDRSTRRASHRWLLLGASAFIVFSLLGVPNLLGASNAHASASPSAALSSPAHPAVQSAAASAAASAPSAAAPRPAATIFNPYCYKIDLGVCVSICNQTESNIVPNIGSFISSVEPNASADLPLCIKSQVPLDWPAAAHSGQKSPILLNVSGVLWNGDPFYSIYSGDYWHGNNPTQIWTGPTQVPTNKSGYIYWYQVVISAKSSTGVQNFFPGETVTWWIELTYNQSNTFIHRESPHFQFTYSGAWPYSPYPGSAQYAGASATFEDINLTVTPRSPNWNDTVSLVLNTTQADAISNATIGSAYVDLLETAPNGATLQTGTIAFPVSIAAGNFGATSTKVTIPASYAQTEGATVSYWLTVYDTATDQLTTPVANYVVGGNGSFLSGICIDDLNLQTNPQSVIIDPLGQAMLNPGQTLNVSVTSRNLGTAISAAEVLESVSYPLLHEVVHVAVPLVRMSSTEFQGVLTGLPLGSFVNFTILAWDFTQRLESCPSFGYFTPDFPTYVPIVQGNSTFFYIFVYDNSSHTWVTGAHVQVLGPHGSYNSVANTTLGVAYPNQTRNAFLPLLLPANNSYQIFLTWTGFDPGGGLQGGPINVTIRGLHAMTNRQSLVQGPNYEVVQEANAIVFWLNTTPASTPASPAVNAGGGIPLAGVLGLIATGGAAIPLALWWRQIRAKRKEEEKRVTL